MFGDEEIIVSHVFESFKSLIVGEVVMVFIYTVTGKSTSNPTVHCKVICASLNCYKC